MKKMFNKKVLIIICIFFFLLVAGIFLYPMIKEKKEISSLQKEIAMVKDYLSSKEDLNSIQDYIKKNITKGKRHDVELSIDKYLTDVLDNEIVLNKLVSDEKINETFLIENINNKDNLVNDLEYLKSKEEEIKKVKENYQLLIDSRNNYLSEAVKDEKLIKLYNELIDKLDLHDKDSKIDNFIDNLQKKEMILDYLNKNKNTWIINDSKIEFNKRKNYNEYSKIIQDNALDIQYSLINDDKGPVITASNLTITKGNKIDLKSKVKCIDAVDDNVSCKITGTYDINKVGSYNINISATDESKNTSNKTIKLTVKEKTVNKKPYYIEVIRNHNVVVVYGLDSNNEYTKVVKVFVCSVGLNGKTPTGTFKTSDKAAWGWLVGNVYGQYYTRIKGSILFHSVPYYKKAKNQLEWEEYNKLGTAASKGCVRLSVRDVKWIYNNCPSGTTVKIYDGNLPSGVTKPSAIKIDGSSPNKGWDPTDPDKNNPWNK